MRTIHQIEESCNPCRDIVEGRRKLQPLATVPFVAEYRAPAAKPESLPVFSVPAPVDQKRRPNASQFNSFLTSYLAAHPGDFTVQDLEAFAEKCGFAGNVKASVYNWVCYDHLQAVGSRKSINSEHKVTVYRRK